MLANLFINLTIKNITNAIITKFIISVINAPYVKFNFPIFKENSEKLTSLTHPNIGEIIFFVNDVTTVWKALPIKTPTAKSITFPLMQIL